jgi:hypothetical protein
VPSVGASPSTRYTRRAHLSLLASPTHYYFVSLLKARSGYDEILECCKHQPKQTSLYKD